MAERIDVLQLPDHSDRGPSGAERWLDRPDPDNPEIQIGCPASVRLSEGAPDSESWYAAEGTAAHWITELARINGVEASEYLGYSDEKMPDPRGGFFTCDQEMVDGCQSFLDYVNSLPGSVAFFEPKVTYFTWVEGDGFGTSDDIRIAEEQKSLTITMEDDEIVDIETDGVCYVTDFKYGKGVKVDCENNVQLMIYALGVWEMFGQIYEWTHFRLAVHQPRIDHVSEWVISVKDLLEWAENVLRPGAELTMEEDAPIRAGEWCRFCRVRMRCAERAKWILAFGLDNPMMDNYALAHMLPHLDTIRGWCNEIEQLAFKEVNGGAYVGGYYLGVGRGGNRQWRDTDEFERQRKNYKIKVGDAYAPRTPLSPAQFEKAHGKKHPMMKNVFSPPGKPKLSAPGSGDKPYGPDPENEFTDIEDGLADWYETAHEDDLLS